MFKLTGKNKIAILIFFLFLCLVALFFILSHLLRGFEGGDDSGSQIIPEEEIPYVEKEELKIGFVTDAHCYSNNSKKTGYEWSLNWRCTEPLEAFIEKMNNDFHPDFVVDGGDLVDGKDDYGEGSFRFANQLYEKLDAPLYHVLGNHELRDFSVDKWKEIVNYEKAYYYFDIKGFRIVVLDGNYHPTSDGGIEHVDESFSYYPGYIGGEQLIWLKKTLVEAKKMGLTNIVFVHQPPIGIAKSEITELFYNGEEIQGIFEQNNIKVVFSGHIERMCNLEISNTEYYVLQGFWKARIDPRKDPQKKLGVFSEITISPSGEIKTEMFYHYDRADDYKSILVDTENADCLSAEILEPLDDDLDPEE